MENSNAIKPEWNKYYNTLEQIRKSGTTNMYGAAPVLAELEGIDEELAHQILANWMFNYPTLDKQFGWRD